MSFCDTHIHLLAPEWQTPLEERLDEARAAGIDLLLQPGVRRSDWSQLLRNCAAPPVYAAPGLHPICAGEWNDDSAAMLRELCAQPKVLAIGEIGLDAVIEVDLQVQQKAFCGQLELARAAGLPILIHCRKRSDAILSLIREADFRNGGIWHGFSGSLETARQILNLGFVLGVGPVLLRENARKLPEVVRQVDSEHLVLETDAPDMAAGPEVLIDVARKLAKLRGWTMAECARITSENARRVLKV